MLEIAFKLLDQKVTVTCFTVRSSQMMLGIVIKLLDQRSYSHMFYSQIITDDVRDSH